jgi:Trk-type K+ transport system membrane component
MNEAGGGRRKKLTPPLPVIIGFLSVINAGTILLLLPWPTARVESPGLITALITATSATWVTGLFAVGTGSCFSLFGQSVILVLTQIGGLGIMTLSTAFSLLPGRKMTVALGTVGLATGITHHQTTLGKLIITLVVFIGRKEPLTPALAVGLRESKTRYRYPEMNIMVG